MEELIDKVAIVLVLLLFSLSAILSVIIWFADSCLRNKHGQFPEEYEKFDRIFKLIITILWCLIPTALVVILVVLFLIVIGVIK